jgi:hypothetical protein
LNDVRVPKTAKNRDLVLQRVLLALKGAFVDDLDGVELLRSVLALGKFDLRERSAENDMNEIVLS